MKNIEINNITIKVIAVILYRIALDIVYAFIIHPIYNYDGFLNNASLLTYLISWVVLLLFIPNIISTNRKDNLTSYIVLFLSLITFIPSTSLMAFRIMDKQFFFMYLLYWELIFVFNKYMPTFYFKRFPFVQRYHIMNFITAIFAVCIIYISWRYTGFRLNFELINVYGLREEASKYNIPLILEYILGMSNTILSVMLIYYLCSKDRIKSIALCFVIFLNFSIGGHKSIIFSMFIVIVVYKFYKDKMINYCTWALLLLNVVSLLEYIILHSSKICGILIRRILYVPSLLNYYYYDFFSKNQFDFFRQGILRRFGFTSPYKISISNIIGLNYFNNIDTVANNGLFSDAYFNMGVLGIVIFPFLLILLFRIINACSRGLDNKIKIIIAIRCALSFNSGTMTSMLLNNGILLLIFILYCMPRENERLDVLND